jgi:hypothetical protein
MDTLTREQAFQLHYECENIDDSLMESYLGEDILLGSEKNDREGWSD